MHLELRHLQLLVALDEWGTLHAAAKRLHLTPSALSLQLRELEQRLGGRLFERRWRRLHVTAAGQRLTTAARTVLAELSRAEDEARRLLSGHAGVLRLTTECTQSYRWLPRVMEAWERSHPDVRLELVAEAGGSPLDWLRERRLDLAIVVGGRPADPRLSHHRLFRDELVALVGRTHPEAKAERIALKALAREHYWGAEDSFSPGTPLGDALERAGVRFARVTALPFLSGVPLEMVRAGRGVTVCPRWFVQDSLRRREVVALSIGRGLWLDWFVATPAVTASPATDAFVALLRQHHPFA
ncbi:LysR family transcriptional regulator [Corallococcus exiguus]|uniref:LysR family transcriptional regulator n=1 Tax=Corallococcus exiguus TaxID=83462 RepID=UPI00156124D3|nr:LysR family transcriptional regulator [Corallococcus exiguus]NRD43549.1 LysR family transcriptional regulator [Corallococcus exiguus]